MPTDATSLLQRRVNEFDIPPWPGEAQFERVLVYQLPDSAAASDTFIKGGLIAKPDNRKSTDQKRSPRGIIVSAGLRAMDILRDNGMEVGELIWMSPNVFYRYEVGKHKNGQPIEFAFMNIGDIVLSEDIINRVWEEKSLVLTRINSKHVYQGISGTGMRVDPTQFPDDI